MHAYQKAPPTVIMHQTTGPFAPFFHPSAHHTAESAVKLSINNGDNNCHQSILPSQSRLKIFHQNISSSVTKKAR